MSVEIDKNLWFPKSFIVTERYFNFARNRLNLTSHEGFFMKANLTFQSQELLPLIREGFVGKKAQKSKGSLSMSLTYVQGVKVCG